MILEIHYHQMEIRLSAPVGAVEHTGIAQN